MGHFSDLLTTAVAASGLTQAEVEKRTGIERSALSRLMSGALPPSRINLERIFSKFQPNTMVGHELVFAHLRDEAHAAGVNADQLQFHLSAGDSPREKLPVSVVTDLDLLASEAVTNTDFRALITDWAKVVRNHHAALERNVYPFPVPDKAHKVAEEGAKPKTPRRAGADSTLPRGASQAPTA